MTAAPERAPDRDVPTLITEIIAIHAADLARRGRYTDAEQLIVPILDSGHVKPELLDLLARIRVRQGRVEDAKLLWRDALAKDSGNLGYRSALDCVSKTRHPAAKRIAAFIVAGVAFASLPLGVGIHNASRPMKTPPTLTRLAAVETRPQLRPEQFRSSHATAESQGDAIKIVFNDPLFSDDAHLTRTGQLALAEFAEKLRPIAGTVELKLVGETDGVPPRKAGVYSDNRVLGLMRAVAAYNEIRRRIQELRGPNLTSEAHEHPTAAFRSPKQRTVAIIVTPARQPNH